MGQPDMKKKKVPYETFDIDLKKGKACEDAFAHVLLHCKIEHKRDYKCAKTGNLAVEYEYKLSNGDVHRSGLSITTARFYSFEFLDERYLLIKTDSLKQIARRAIKEGLHDWIGDGKNHHNALVPIKWLTEMETKP